MAFEIHKTACGSWELHLELLGENNEVLRPINLGSMDWIQTISYSEEDSFITLDNNSLSSNIG